MIAPQIATPRMMATCPKCSVKGHTHYGGAYCDNVKCDLVGKRRDVTEWSIEWGKLSLDVRKDIERRDRDAQIKIGDRLRVVKQPYQHILHDGDIVTVIKKHSDTLLDVTGDIIRNNGQGSPVVKVPLDLVSAEVEIYHAPRRRTIDAVIRDAIIVGQPGKPQHVSGLIEADTRERFKDGTWVRSSNIAAIYKNVVYTVSGTVYFVASWRGKEQ